MFFVPSRRLQKFSNPRMPREMAKMMGQRKNNSEEAEETIELEEACMRTEVKFEVILT